MSRAVQSRLLADVLCWLILDTVGYWSGLFAGAEGPCVSYLCVGARDGLDQILADENRSNWPSAWTSQRAPA